MKYPNVCKALSSSIKFIVCSCQEVERRNIKCYGRLTPKANNEVRELKDLIEYDRAVLRNILNGNIKKVPSILLELENKIPIWRKDREKEYEAMRKRLEAMKPVAKLNIHLQEREPIVKKVVSKPVVKQKPKLEEKKVVKVDLNKPIESMTYQELCMKLKQDKGKPFIGMSRKNIIKELKK